MKSGPWSAFCNVSKMSVGKTAWTKIHTRFWEICSPLQPDGTNQNRRKYAVECDIQCKVCKACASRNTLMGTGSEFRAIPERRPIPIKTMLNPKNQAIEAFQAKELQRLFFCCSTSWLSHPTLTLTMLIWRPRTLLRSSALSMRLATTTTAIWVHASRLFSSS